MNASPEMQRYFEEIGREIKKGYQIAEAVRLKNLDPESEVPIPLAKTMAERVVGLVSVVAPQITNNRITEHRRIRKKNLVCLIGGWDLRSLKR